MRIPFILVVKAANRGPLLGFKVFGVQPPPGSFDYIPFRVSTKAGQVPSVPLNLRDHKKPLSSQSKSRACQAAGFSGELSEGGFLCYRSTRYPLTRKREPV